MELLIFSLFCLSTVFPILHLFHSLPFFNRRDIITAEQTGAPEKGISILIPCYNEAAILNTSIDHVRALAYSSLEVIYINDGSDDDTFLLLKNKLQLVQCERPTSGHLSHKEVLGLYQSSVLPYVYVIDKVNGGKADSLNAGIEHSLHDLVITLDADSILSHDALKLANQAFQDPNVVAAGGMVHVLQTKSGKSFSKLTLKSANWLIRAQMLDLMKAFYITKVSLARFRALSIISGAFGIFDKKILTEVGGYRSTLGEDIDITLRIQRYILKHTAKRIVFLPNAVCYTELPENGRDVFKQRVRWQKAFIDCIIHFAPFFGRTFFRKPVSFFCIFETFIGSTLTAYVMSLILIQHVFEAPSSILGHLLLYVVVTMVFGFVYDVMGIVYSHYYGVRFTRKEWRGLLAGILFDITFFRFLNVFYVMYGTIAYFFNRNSWNKVSRTGRRYKTAQPLNEKTI